MLNRIEEPEDLARRLEATGNYKILRRLIPQQATPLPTGCTGKVGIIVDFETTGLDANKDEIIEVAMVKFGYTSRHARFHTVTNFRAWHRSVPRAD